MATLKGEVHPVKTIKSRMVKSATNLAWDPRVKKGSSVGGRRWIWSTECWHCGSRSSHGILLKKGRSVLVLSEV
jgi:hypothetical protein